MWLSTHFQIERSPFVLSTTEPGVYEKQVAYVGKFVKHKPGMKPEPFEITHAKIDHWNKTVALMLSDGIEIPMPVEHQFSSEAKRGNVVGARVGLDEKGRYSLFLRTKFINPEAEKQHIHSNVSIFVPDFYVNAATQKKYDEPITHLALTSYPVLPGLGPFQALALSMELDKGVTKMPMQADLTAIATELGLDPATADEAAVLAKIKEWKALVEKKPDQQNSAPPGGASANPATPLPPGAKVSYEVPKIAASLVTREVGNRARDIDDLVKDGKITTATATSLKSKWCAEPTVRLALSMETGDDGFGSIIETLKLNQPQVNVGGSKTGMQLSHSASLPNPNGGRQNAGGAGQSRTVQMAKEIAEKAAKRGKRGG